jgi:hypothetical protein
MTLLDKLQAHKGGLLQLKTQLYWYGRGGWDNNPGRICLILDAARVSAAPNVAAAGFGARALTCEAQTALAAATAALTTRAAAFLLIDGQPHWVWVVEADVDLLVNDPPAN